MVNDRPSAAARWLDRLLVRVARLQVLALLLGSAACTDRSSPSRLTGTGVTPAVWGVLRVPTSPGTHPGVILLPGSSGWHADYATFAKALADSGFVALAIDYYGETGRGNSRAGEIRRWPVWQATIRNAITLLSNASTVAGKPIALIGYSRGAMLAISTGASRPTITAIVDFYGAGSDDDPADSQIAHFPALLMFHGEADSNISVDVARRLYDRLHAHGADVELHVYPNTGHGFNTPWSPGYSSAAAADSWARTVAFLREKLKN